mgnify:CR=1 FL=1
MIYPGASISDTGYSFKVRAPLREKVEHVALRVSVWAV